MSDSQLMQSITQLSHAASGAQYQSFASPTPQRSQLYQKNIQNWSNSSTPPPRAASSTNATSTAPRRSGRAAKASSATPQQPHVQLQQQQQTQAQQQQQNMQNTTPANSKRNPAAAPIPTVRQALNTSYPSRLRTGTTLLLQPILALSQLVPAPAAPSRSRKAVSYAEPGSGDELPDAGELDSDGSDFVASGGLRTSVRNARLAGGTVAVASPRPATAASGELDQSYLGMMPPARFITSKPPTVTKLDDFTDDQLDVQSLRPSAPVPIRVEFETDTHRVRDCFVWDAAERLVTPEAFARTFCADLDLPATWADTVAAQIRAQLEEHEPIATMDLAVDGAAEGTEDVPECRVVLSIDVQVDNHHLMDHIEWDLRSPLTPEAFTLQLCHDLGLSGEALPLIAHAIHEELLKHKKDVVEWGVAGGSPEEQTDGAAALLKDKTGLGMGWSRTPREGRGPRVLRSVWRDWAEAEEFQTRWEELTAEEVERREIERERASRRLRRETSKFQSSARTRRR
ncbi:hypothetical protein K488DRAFT_78798 [Vararia minispora EC-137]|uniref:Uncharacterized protein n=1 Tax=Vararia minispora EC-137 TaxID=1314806 RepID=A0ACB8QJU6_9AGAM|nr:hypothetical protein K488DRAFT_78798 [Vararia minispora EC-137]